MSITNTPLSGVSGALYYRPAGTSATFSTSNVDTSAETITAQLYRNFEVGDPVRVSIINAATGADVTPDTNNALPAGTAADTTYVIRAYAETTGVLKLAATATPTTDLDITSSGTLAAGNVFQINYYGADGSNDTKGYSAIGQVKSWSLDIDRTEIEVTTIGETQNQYAPFRKYIPGFADANGSATVYVTEDDDPLANRMVEDVLRRYQGGCAVKLYVDKKTTEAASRSISMEAVLLKASRSVNPDDAQMVEIEFRATRQPDFDFSTT